MSRIVSILARLRADRRGAAAIEAALVTPVLLMLSLGSFQVSSIVARQAELQGAVQEAASIALSSKPDTWTKRRQLEAIIRASTGLEGQAVFVNDRYRCGTATTLRFFKEECGSTDVASYVSIQIQDTYTPVWAHYGIGRPLNFNVIRFVQLEQD